MEQIDIAIIGAGVIGLAVAAEISKQHPRAVIALLEANKRWGQETSSRNSEVIHAGLYYPAQSLKTQLCLEGNRLLYEYCADRGVPCRAVGKMVVALNEDEIPDLESLYEHACGVGAEVELLSAQACQAMEPLIPARAALFSPCTGIIDSEALMRSLFNQATENGVAALMAAPLQAAEKTDHGYRLQTPYEVIDSRTVINCAGLKSDIVAAMALPLGDKPSYQLHYCKGEYYSLRSRLPIKHLVYPLPGRHSLGVHLTMDMAGNQRLGPNAYYVPEIDYSMDERYADEFVKQASVMLPGLIPTDIMPGYAGIRPKLQGPDQPFRDFVIQDEAISGLPGWINLIGIESPGLTSCLAIAKMTARLVQPYL